MKRVTFRNVASPKEDFKLPRWFYFLPVISCMSYPPSRDRWWYIAWLKWCICVSPYNARDWVPAEEVMEKLEAIAEGEQDS